MNPTFKTVSRASVANRSKNCYLCDATVPSIIIRNVDQLFYEDPKRTDDQSKSLASILSDILEQNVDESTAHSKILCRKCQQMCVEYNQLATRMHKLKENITHSFNETANKHNLKVIEMDLGHNYEAISHGDDGNISNMYAIESVDSAIGEVFNNENVDDESGSVGVGVDEKGKKVMLIKSESGANPFFTISGSSMLSSGIHESIGDDQTIHTVSDDKILRFFFVYIYARENY